MIVLDTNVISEMMRDTPNPSVSKWIGGFRMSNFAVTAITIAEISRGIARLPNGKKKRKLEENFQKFVRAAFQNRVLSFDEEAAFLYGEMAANREKLGLSVDAVDMMIAAIARKYGATIASRNVKDFEGCGLHLIDPWNEV